MGRGNQFVSWIHGDDFCRAVEWLIDHDEFSGPVNLASPNPVPNRDLMRTLRRLCKMPIGLPATRWMLEVGAFFLRTETELILKSRRVVPRRLARFRICISISGVGRGVGEYCAPAGLTLSLASAAGSESRASGARSASKGVFIIHEAGRDDYRRQRVRLARRSRSLLNRLQRGRWSRICLLARLKSSNNPGRRYLGNPNSRPMRQSPAASRVAIGRPAANGAKIPRR